MAKLTGVWAESGKRQSCGQIYYNLVSESSLGRSETL